MAYFLDDEASADSFVDSLLASSPRSSVAGSEAAADAEDDGDLGFAVHLANPDLAVACSAKIRGIQGISLEAFAPSAAAVGLFLNLNPMVENDPVAVSDAIRDRYRPAGAGLAARATHQVGLINGGQPSFRIDSAMDSNRLAVTIARQCALGKPICVQERVGGSPRDFFLDIDGQMSDFSVFPLFIQGDPEPWIETVVAALRKELPPARRGLMKDVVLAGRYKGPQLYSRHLHIPGLTVSPQEHAQLAGKVAEALQKKYGHRFPVDMQPIVGGYLNMLGTCKVDGSDCILPLGMYCGLTGVRKQGPNSLVEWIIKASIRPLADYEVQPPVEEDDPFEGNFEEDRVEAKVYKVARKQEKGLEGFTLIRTCVAKHLIDLCGSAEAGCNVRVTKKVDGILRSVMIVLPPECLTDRRSFYKHANIALAGTPIRRILDGLWKATFFDEYIAYKDAAEIAVRVQSWVGRADTIDSDRNGTQLKEYFTFESGTYECLTEYDMDGNSLTREVSFLRPSASPVMYIRPPAAKRILNISDPAKHVGDEQLTLQEYFLNFAHDVLGRDFFNAVLRPGCNYPQAMLTLGALQLSLFYDVYHERDLHPPIVVMVGATGALKSTIVRSMAAIFDNRLVCQQTNKGYYEMSNRVRGFPVLVDDAHKATSSSSVAARQEAVDTWHKFSDGELRSTSMDQLRPYGGLVMTANPGFRGPVSDAAFESRLFAIPFEFADAERLGKFLKTWQNNYQVRAPECFAELLQTDVDYRDPWPVADEFCRRLDPRGAERTRVLLYHTRALFRKSIFPQPDDYEAHFRRPIEAFLANNTDEIRLFSNPMAVFQDFFVAVEDLWGKTVGPYNFYIDDRANAVHGTCLVFSASVCRAVADKVADKGLHTIGKALPEAFVRMTGNGNGVRVPRHNAKVLGHDVARGQLKFMSKHAFQQSLAERTATRDVADLVPRRSKMPPHMISDNSEACFSFSLVGLRKAFSDAGIDLQSCGKIGVAIAQ